jgi:hypothetical protein
MIGPAQSQMYDWCSRLNKRFGLSNSLIFEEREKT